MKRYLLGSVLALTLAAGYTTAGSRLAAHEVQKQERPAAEDVRPSLERVVTGAVDPDGPGAAVLVVKDGKVLLKKGYGLADLDKRTPVTSETTPELASGSKPFTALAILLLEKAGKLDLSDDVRK
jgi:CubicO group peptidase (beta-lactamase class C family)